MEEIKSGDYNDARKLLKDQGSKSADKSHQKHGKKTFPAAHGQQLLREARDEFRKMAKDEDPKKLRAGMLKKHHDAIHTAAKKMGINVW